MKIVLLYLFACLAYCFCQAQSPQETVYRFTDASTLTIVGKIHSNTPNPYHRVDTCIYKGFTKSENTQVRCSAGLAVLFSTNSSTISVRSQYGYQNRGVNTMEIARRGYDLYIKKGGEWRYAASGVLPIEKSDQNLILIKNMNTREKECMLYLPLYSELYRVEIGTTEDAEIKPLSSPFKYSVGIFGSSYTQGISTSRSGMSYPMQLMRETGFQLLSLGCSGNCKMQDYFAEVLADAQIDALILDCFSNPEADMIEERLFGFIEKVQASHPNIPLIFMQTIYREKRNFDLHVDSIEQAKQETARRLMAVAVKRYKNVYFIPTNATDKKHETSVDGIHPSDGGYQLWMQSIKKPICKILKKYGMQ